MYRKSICLVFAFLMVLMAAPVFGAEILAPGDFIIAIDADGGSNSPAAEPVVEAIDGITTGGGAKYLNFGEENSGFIVTPSAGPSVVTSFVIWTANDAEERDPATWELYGTNESIVSVDHSTGEAENWTLIGSGSVTLPAARNVIGPTVPVSNTASYTSYKMLFPTVKDAGAANSMQIAEIQFYGEANAARNPVPADGSNVGAEYFETNVYMILDYTPGEGAVTHTAYFSDNEQDVIDRDPAHSLGSVPPWPAFSPTAFVVGYDDPGIPEYARTPLVPGVTYYWAIDTFDGADTWFGKVWSFTVMPKEAWDQYPADGAISIPTDVTATWRLGDTEVDDKALSYNVYWGADEAAVAAVATADTTSPLYAGNVATETIDLIGLNPETVIYWRVDTQLALTRPPFTIEITKGAVWSFETLPEVPIVPIVEEDLVGWWKLDGDMTYWIAFDSSGYANHGEYRGDAAFAAGNKIVPGHEDNALDFDGGDYVYTGKSASDLGIEGNNPKSVSVWVFTRSFNNGGIWDLGARSNGQNFCLRTLGADNNWRTQYWGPDDADFTYPSLNEWVHFGLVHDGVSTVVYANAQVVVDVPRTLATSSANPFQIGVYGWQNDYFNGLIDDFRLYKRALSAKEIKILAGFLNASDPDPANGASDVSRTPTLGWSPGAFAAAVDGSVVYYSEDRSAVANRTAPNDTVTTPSFEVLTELDLGATFYWAVDTINGAETWPGDIWSFTTTNWISVDDMESYTPWTTPGNNIFEAWRDAEGNCEPGNGNDTGSILTEVLDPLFVRSGFQSMKYEYDNDGTVFSPCDSIQEPGRLMYSRIEAQVAGLASGIGTDWTIEGVKALRLPFMGQNGNATTESLWVQLQDSSKTYGAKVFYGDFEGESLDDFNDASWHEWNIDMADFGVDLENVVSIVIGIGDESKATAGGSGTLYFDDMRLYVPQCVPSRSSEAFGKLDYSGPAGGPDCIVDYHELSVMGQDWLQSDRTVNPATLPTGPVAWYNFENNLLDSSGNGNNGTAEAGETYVAGVAGMALDFDGVADAVDCGNDPSIDITDGVTLSAWIKLSGPASDQKIAGNQSGAGGGYKMGLFGDVLEFEVRNSTNASVLTRGAAGGTALTPGVWYYVAGVYSSQGGYLRTYIDGKLDTQMTTNAILDTSSGSLILGREPFSSLYFFSGTMDDVRVYDYALTHGQILTVGGISTPLYIGIASPANVIDGEGINNLKINFRDYAELLNNWLETEKWPQ